VVLRRLLSGLFACALALAGVAGAPPTARAPGARWLAAEQLIAAPPARGEARLGRAGEVRVVPGAAGLPVALLPAPVGLAAIPPVYLLFPGGETRRPLTPGTPAWSARGPPV
jgi:hypothetical protein